MFAFDLDGTLVDTKRAVELSYIDAGVKPPEGFWGRPWKEWLNKPEVHAAKQTFYLKHLKKHGKLLPLGQWLAGGEAPSRWMILTGASAASAKIVLDLYELHPTRVYTGLNTDEKIELLNLEGSGVYWDDDWKALEQIGKGVKNWTLCHVMN